MITNFNKYKLNEEVDEIEIVKDFNRDTSERAYIDTDGNYITLKNGDNDPKAHDKILDLLGTSGNKEFDFLHDNNWIKISMRKMMYFFGSGKMTQKQMDTLKDFYTAKGIKRFTNGINYEPVDIEVLDYLTPDEFTKKINL